MNSSKENEIAKKGGENAPEAGENDELDLRMHIDPDTLNVSEPEVEYLSGKKQGGFTLDDYYALPDERRAELIDGVIYDMGAPTTVHQLWTGEFYRVIANYIRDRHGDCVPLVAPVDVQLDCDDRTMLQPDVLIVCDRSKVIKRCVYGAPDFIIEVLSPSTKKRDMYQKLQKYKAAGVKEYWMADPEQKRVLVYDFLAGNAPVIYGFEDKIPLAVFHGDLQIDMKDILEAIPFWDQE